MAAQAFPPHDVGRGNREAGEGPPRHAAERWGPFPKPFAACGRDPFDPSFAKASEGPLPRKAGKKGLPLDCHLAGGFAHVVGTRHHPPIGAAVCDQYDIALPRVRHQALGAQAVGGFADRADDIGDV